MARKKAEAAADAPKPSDASPDAAEAVQATAQSDAKIATNGASTKPAAAPADGKADAAASTDGPAAAPADGKAGGKAEAKPKKKAKPKEKPVKEKGEKGKKGQGKGKDQAWARPWAGYGWDSWAEDEWTGAPGQPAWEPWRGGYPDPQSQFAPTAQMPAASHTWLSYGTPQGPVYYYNYVTGVTQWEKPEEMVASEVVEPAPGADESPSRGKRPCTLFVFHLPEEWRTDGHLKQHFSTFGHIQNAHVMVDRESRDSRGFGFVEYATEEEAQAAIAAMNGHRVLGKRLKVEIKQLPRKGKPKVQQVVAAESPAAPLLGGPAAAST